MNLSYIGFFLPVSSLIAQQRQKEIPMNPRVYSENKSQHTINVAIRHNIKICIPHHRQISEKLRQYQSLFGVLSHLGIP